MKKKRLYIKQFLQVIFCITFLAMVSTFQSCQSEDELDLSNIKKQIVVEGWIEQGNYPLVMLTYNANYFSQLDSNSFRALVASRAKVTVSDGEQSEILTLDRDTNYFPPWVYKGFEIIGKVGKTYTLTVEDEIGTATATTTILPPPAIDSVWFEYKSPNDTVGVIKGRFTDNANEKNYYKTYTKIYRKEKKYYPTLLSSFGDQFFNGEQVTFTLKKGPETYLKPIKDIYFHKGDSLFVKFSSIDEASYNFWLSYDKEVVNTGNPFAGNHNTIQSNIKEGLGIWSGYGSKVFFIVAK
jgi:hypothetical protein